MPLQTYKESIMAKDYKILQKSPYDGTLNLVPKNLQDLYFHFHSENFFASAKKLWSNTYDPDTIVNVNFEKRSFQRIGKPGYVRIEEYLNYSANPEMDEEFFDMLRMLYVVVSKETIRCLPRIGLNYSKVTIGPENLRKELIKTSYFMMILCSASVLKFVDNLCSTKFRFRKARSRSHFHVGMILKVTWSTYLSVQDLLANEISRVCPNLEAERILVDIRSRRNLLILIHEHFYLCYILTPNDENFVRILADAQNNLLLSVQKAITEKLKADCTNLREHYMAMLILCVAYYAIKFSLTYKNS